MLTAFFGVSLGLFDFLADGLNLRKNGSQGKCTLALTFLPPLAVVLIKPCIYLQALGYAGGCCVVLLLLLPAIMAGRGREADDGIGMIMIRGGRHRLAAVGIITVALLYIAPTTQALSKTQCQHLDLIHFKYFIESKKIMPRCLQGCKHRVHQTQLIF